MEYGIGADVYCPSIGTSIFTLREHPTFNSGYMIKVGSNQYSISEDGKRGVLPPDHNPVAIFHANVTNYKALTTLHGDVFEPPYVHGSELVRQLISDGCKAIVCKVSNSSDKLAITHHSVRVITGISSNGCFTASNGRDYKYAVPIDTYTKPVTSSDLN